MADELQQGNLPNNQDWRSDLPDDLRFNDGLSKFKDKASIAKSYLELERKFGTMTTLPKEDSKPEDWDKFHKTWGRPDTYDKYNFPELPDGLKVDDAFGGSVKSLAHKMGLNQKQFNQLVDWGKEQSLGIMSEQQKASEENEKKLKADWGFRYGNNVEKAHKTLATLVNFKEDHPFLQYLETSKMGDSPEFLKFLLELSDRFGEDKFIDSKVQTQETEKNDALKRINEVRADMKHPYHNDKDPRHGDAVKEMSRLYQLAYDEKK